MAEPRWTRRELLTRGAGAVLGGGAAVAGGYLLYDPKGDRGLPRWQPRLGLKNFFAQIDLPAGHPRLSVAVGPEHRTEELVRAAVGGLDPALGLRRFVQPGDVVLIKPNVGFDRPPHVGATTNPEVLRWIIRLCREAGAREILVTDNPIESPQACFSRSGIAAAVETEGAKVVLPAPAQFELVLLGQPQARSRAPGTAAAWPVLYRPLDRATKLIGVAPIKDHNLSSASMTLKNWYGLLGGRRHQLHQTIHEAISDLAALLSPTLVIADGTRVMLHNGPTGGRVSDVRPGGQLGRPVLVASVDPVACDAWCYQRLLGRDPAALDYLRLAEQKIQARVAAGERRFGQRDWLAYDRAGQVVTTTL